MKVFQSTSDVKMHVHYDRYLVKTGQLIRADTPELIKFLTAHVNMRVITDERMIPLAPPIHLVKQPEDPYRMRKEDIIDELRSYGIAVDIYTFSDKLSMQLRIARNMKQRNFLTVLNNRGVPIFIDEARLPIPVTTMADERLPEPEVNVEDIILEDGIDPKQVQEEIKSRDHVLKEAELKDNGDVDLMGEKREKVMMVEPIIDEEYEKNKGLEHFEDWVGKEYDRPDIDKEKNIKEFLFKEQGPSIEEIEIAEKLREKGITNEQILPQNFLYLIDTNKRFCLEEVTQEEYEKIREIKWTAINFDVVETYLRNHNIRVEYDESKTAKRWAVNKRVKEIYDEAIEKDVVAVELNMLQKRHDELVKLEPDYRKFTDKTLRRRTTELSKYGLNVWYNKDTNIRKHCQRLYTIAKLGLDVPDTEEEIIDLLNTNRRSKVV